MSNLKLTREECEKARDIIYKHVNCDEMTTEEFNDSIVVFNNLINEHFELKEKYSKILDDVHDYRYEIQFMKVTIRNLCKHFGVNNQEELKNIYLNKPLKFEELKEGMWVWDNQTKRYMKVYDISYSEKAFNVNGEWYLDDLYLEEFEFEDGRFYLKEVKDDEN